MPGVQEQELLNHEEQEYDHRPLRVLEVLQYLPQAHGPQGNEVVSSRIRSEAFPTSFRITGGVSSTVKLSVSKTELLGSNPSSPASLPGSLFSPGTGSPTACYCWKTPFPRA